MKVHHRSHTLHAGAATAAAKTTTPKLDAAAEQKASRDMFAAVPKEVVRIVPPAGAPHGAPTRSLGWSQGPSAITEEAMGQLEGMRAKEGGGWYEVKATITQGGGETGAFLEAKRQLEAKFPGASAHLLTDGEGVTGDTVTLKVNFPGASKADGSYVPPPPAESHLPELYTAKSKEVAKLEPLSGSTLPARTGGTQQVSGEAMSGTPSAEVIARAAKFTDQAMAQLTRFAERGGGGWYEVQATMSNEGGELSGLMDASHQAQARWPKMTAAVMTASDVPVAGDTVTLKVKFPALQMSK